MTTTINTNAITYLSEVRLIIESKPENIEAAISELSRKYSGDENRFIRQDIIEALIGIKHPLVKCGIGMLTSFTMTYLDNLKAEATAPAPEPTTEPDGIAGIDYPLPGEVTVSEKIETAAERGEKAIAKSEASAEIAAMVGLKVIRKECQRKGEVIAIEGQHVTVLLEDGSKRKPCMSRFKKLYNAA
jgi:hypothetical protein